MTDVPPCLRCGIRLRNSFAGSVPQPSGGTLLTSRGNYGSTLWDPGGTRDRRWLLAVICDQCLAAARDAGQILVATPPPPDTRPPDVRVWDNEEERE